MITESLGLLIESRQCATLMMKVWNMGVTASGIIQPVSEVVLIILQVGRNLVQVMVMVLPGLALHFVTDLSVPLEVERPARSLSQLVRLSLLSDQEQGFTR